MAAAAAVVDLQHRNTLPAESEAVQVELSELHAAPTPRKHNKQPSTVLAAERVAYEGVRLRATTLRQRLDREQFLRSGYRRLFVWTCFLLVVYVVIAMQSRITDIYPLNAAARAALDGDANANRFSDISRPENVYAWLGEVVFPQLFSDDSGLVRSCHDGNEVVSYDQWCDGSMDCADGSDEVGCESRECSDGFVACTDVLVPATTETSQTTSPTTIVVAEYAFSNCSGDPVATHTYDTSGCHSAGDGTSFQVAKCTALTYSTPDCSGVANTRSVSVLSGACDGHGRRVVCSGSTLPSEPDAVSLLILPTARCYAGGASGPSALHFVAEVAARSYLNTVLTFRCRFGDRDAMPDTWFECGPTFSVDVDRGDLSSREAFSQPSWYRLEMQVLGSDGETLLGTGWDEFAAAPFMRCLYSDAPELAGCALDNSQWPLLGDGTCTCSVGTEACLYDLFDCEETQCSGRKSAAPMPPPPSQKGADESNQCVDAPDNDTDTNTDTWADGEDDGEDDGGDDGEDDGGDDGGGSNEFDITYVEEISYLDASCVDDELWVGADFSVCLDYGLDSRRCDETPEFWASVQAQGLSTPATACCACGGGTPVEHVEVSFSYQSAGGAPFLVLDGGTNEVRINATDASCSIPGNIAVLLEEDEGRDWNAIELDIFDCEGNSLAVGKQRTSSDDPTDIKIALCTSPGALLFASNYPMPSSFSFRVVGVEDLEEVSAYGDLDWDDDSEDQFELYNSLNDPGGYDSSVWGYNCDASKWPNAALLELAAQNDNDGEFQEGRGVLLSNRFYNAGVCDPAEWYLFNADNNVLAQGDGECVFTPVDLITTTHNFFATASTINLGYWSYFAPRIYVAVDEAVPVQSRIAESPLSMTINPNFRTITLFYRAPPNLPAEWAPFIFSRTPGILASFSPSGDFGVSSPFTVVTDANWKCKPMRDCDFETGFWLPDYDDSWWPQADVVGPNVGEGATDFAPPKANWIWAADTWFSSVACRYTNPRPVAVEFTVQVTNTSTTVDVGSDETAALLAGGIVPFFGGLGGVASVSVDNATTQGKAVSSAAYTVGVEVHAISPFAASHIVRLLATVTADVVSLAFSPVLGAFVVATVPSLGFVGDPAFENYAPPTITCGAEADLEVEGRGVWTEVTLRVTLSSSATSSTQEVEIRGCARSDSAVEYQLLQMNGATIAEGQGFVTATLATGTYTLRVRAQSAGEVRVVASCGSFNHVVSFVTTFSTTTPIPQTLTTAQIAWMEACVAAAVPHSRCPAAERVLVVSREDQALSLEVTTTRLYVPRVVSALQTTSLAPCFVGASAGVVSNISSGATGAVQLLPDIADAVLDSAAATPTNSDAAWNCSTAQCNRLCNLEGQDCNEGYNPDLDCTCVWECSVCMTVLVQVIPSFAPTTMSWRLGYNHEVHYTERVSTTHEVRLCPAIGYHDLTLFSTTGAGWGSSASLVVTDTNGNVLFQPDVFDDGTEVTHTFYTGISLETIEDGLDFVSVAEGCGALVVLSYAVDGYLTVDQAPRVPLWGAGFEVALVGHIGGRGCHTASLEFSSSPSDETAPYLHIADVHIDRLAYLDADYTWTQFVLADDDESAGNFSECFTCNDGTHIVPWWVCDGTGDCPGGAGEDEGTCFQCGFATTSGNNGQTASVIKLEEQCNGVNDCDDGSDEFYCFSCGDGERVRLNSPLNLVHASQRCDGEAQCPNGKDEAQCEEIVGRCLPPSMVCDFSPDCVVSATSNATAESADESSCASCASYYEKKIARHLSVVGFAWVGVAVRGEKECPDGRFSDFVDTCVRRTFESTEDKVLCVGECSAWNEDGNCRIVTTELLSLEAAANSTTCHEDAPGSVFTRWHWQQEVQAYMTPLTDRRRYKNNEALVKWEGAELINELTGAFKVVLPMFDSTNQVFVILTMTVDIGVEGLMQTNIETTAVDAEQYNFNDPGDVLRFVLELVVVIGAVVDLVSELLEIATYIRSPNRNTLSYFSDPYNLLDWMFYTSFLLCAVFWSAVVRQSWDINIPCGNDADAYITLVGDLLALNRAVNRYQTTLAVLNMTLILKTFKYFDFQPRLSVLNKTLSHAIKYLAPFALVMLYVFVGFSMMAHFTFGDTLREYSHPFYSFMSLVGLMVNDNYYYVNMFSASRWIGIALYYLYALIVMITLFNMTIAIVIDAFLNVNNEEEEHGDASITSEMSRVFRYLWERVKGATPLRPSCLDEARLRRVVDQMPANGQETYSKADLVALFKYTDRQAEKILGHYGEEDDVTRLVKASEEMGIDNKRLAWRLSLQLDEKVDELGRTIGKTTKSQAKKLQALEARMQEMMNKIDALAAKPASK